MKLTEGAVGFHLGNDGVDKDEEIVLPLAHQHTDFSLSRLASLYNIAFATNRTTADMLLTSTLLGDESYTRIDPECIKHYANRKL